MSLNILFLGGAKRVSIAQHLIEYGRFKGIEVKIYSYELDDKVPIAEVGEVICGLRWNNPSIIEDLLQIVETKNIKVILPFVDPAISIASVLKTKSPNVFIPVSDEHLCNIMFDKYESAVWFKKHNISQPIFYDDLSDVEYPIILKPRKGSASKGIIVCHSKNEASQLNLESYLVQEYIESPIEYSVDCYVASDRRVLSIVPRVRLETSGGEAVRSMTMRDDTIIKQSEMILNQEGFKGPITIQYLKDKKGNVFVMEINPRLGGGVVTSIGAGSGMVSFIIEEALGNKVNPIYDWKDGTIMARYFKEVIFYADNH